MKSLLQDGDECGHEDGSVRTVSDNVAKLRCADDYLLLYYFTEDLKRRPDGEQYLNIVRVIRNGKIIWQQTQPINKMMTFELNGVEHPVANHENMKIIVDQVSELEAKVMELQAKLNEILK